MHAVVTGASAGIGFETAKALALRGYAVSMTGRNKARTLACAARIRRETGNERVYASVADFSSLASVRALAETLSARMPRIDLLVNNAGLWVKQHARTDDGFEMTYGVNHLAPFLLTHLLLSRLLDGRIGAPARIVFVSSGLHADGGPFKLDEPPTFRGLHAYARSKLANVLIANEFAHRLRVSNAPCTSNAVHPGAVQTSIVRANMFLRAGIRVAGPFLRSPAEGAQTTLYASCEPSLERVSGAYFADSRQVPPSPFARDREVGRRLWERSLRDVSLVEQHPSDATDRGE